jgi:hypothetical protein
VNAVGSGAACDVGAVVDENFRLGMARYFGGFFG